MEKRLTKQLNRKSRFIETLFYLQKTKRDVRCDNFISLWYFAKQYKTIQKLYLMATMKRLALQHERVFLCFYTSYE